LQETFLCGQDHNFNFVQIESSLQWSRRQIREAIEL